MVIVWGENLSCYQPWVFVDGKQMPWDRRSRAAKEQDPAVWEKSPPAQIRIDGVVDELRAYPYAMTEPELANAYARAAGREMNALHPIDARFDYRMSTGRLTVLLNVRAHYGKAAGASIVLHGPERALEAVTEKYQGGAGSASFSVGELPVGRYPVAITVLDGEGRPLDRGQFEFERIDLPWLHNRLGCGDEVYPPFTAVEVEGRKVACVQREYTVADTGLPRSIVVQSREILASPVVFEFDGMARYEVTVAPAGGPVTVDRLALAVPLKAQYGEEVHALPIGGGFRDYEVARRLSSKDGVVWESRTGFPRGDVKPTVGSFVPMVWLGGVVRGLCYFADNDRGWVPGDAHPAVTVTRRQGTITLRLNFVGEPFVLSEPRKITFALLATPTKPLSRDYRAWGRGEIDKHPLVAGRIYSCDSFAPWKTEPRERAFDVFPRNYDFQLASRCAREQRGSGGKYAPGQPLLMYQDKAWGRTGRDGLYFDWEWKAAGVRRGPLVWSCPSLVDCRVWYWDQYLQHDIYDGIYLDDAFPTHNYNWETGSAYKLPDGRVQPGASFFGVREYLKRVWNLFHVHRKRPIVTVHTTSTLMLPALTFATSVYDGEDTTRMGVHDFLDVWPMERFQVLNDPQRTGLVTLFMFKGSYAHK